MSVSAVYSENVSFCDKCNINKPYCSIGCIVCMECFRQVSCPVAVCDVICNPFKMLHCMHVDSVLYGRCIAGCRAVALLTDSTDHYSNAMCTVSFYMF